MQTRRFLSLVVSLLAITFVTSSARAAPAASRQLWDRVLETGNANKLVLSPDGATAYVSGCNGFCYGKMQTVAYSVSTGKLRWSSIAGGGSSESYDVTVSPDAAKVFATGVVFPPKSAPIAPRSGRRGRWGAPRSSGAPSARPAWSPWGRPASAAARS